MSKTIEPWDIRTYDAFDNPHVRWGRAVLDRLDPEGIRTVIDAGCGTGRVTELLLDRVPAAKVIAIDASRHMLEGAATRLAGALAAGRLELVNADLTRAIAITPSDAIVSTATFHWIDDHDALFANLAAMLRPGG